MEIRIIISFLAFISIANSNIFLRQNITEFIDNQMYNHKVKIVRKYIESAENSPTYTVQWNTLTSKIIKTKLNFSLEIFKKIFVLIENDKIFSMSVHKYVVNNSVNIYQHSLLQNVQAVKFISSTVWNNYLFILVCYKSNFCIIYSTVSGFTLINRHYIISDSELVAASFVKTNNQLLIVVANNFGPRSINSMVYAWTGMYMTPIAKKKMTGVRYVSTMTTKGGTTLIIFTRNYQGSYNGLEIFEISIFGRIQPAIITRIQFLATFSPISLHHYVYNNLDFLLVIDEMMPAQVYLWEQKKFIHWQQVNEFRGRNILLNYVNIDDDTFIFITKKNMLSLYKIMSRSFKLLKSIEIEEISRIVDFQAWNNEFDTISLVIIFEQADKSINAQSWRINLQTFQVINNDMERSDIEINRNLRLCFDKLEQQLRKRMANIEEIKKSVIPSLSLNLITELQSHSHNLKNLKTKMKVLALKSRKLIQRKENKTLVLPSLIIYDDTQFESLRTPLLNTDIINDIPIKNISLKNFFSNETQHFLKPLRGHNITIRNLRVNSLCGITSEHWLLQHSHFRLSLRSKNSGMDQLRIENDTVKNYTNINFPNIDATTLNSVNLKNFTRDVFIIGQRQIINGNLCYRHMLSIGNLTVLNQLNGITEDDLITLTTDQNLTKPIEIDSLNVSHLMVNRINDVSIEDAARVSQNNTISSRLIVTHLKIKNKLLMSDMPPFSLKEYQIHIFNNVQIIGHAVIDHLIVESEAEFILNSTKNKGHDINNLLSNYWTKSTDQVIHSSAVKFQKGLTIDKLNTNYFNGFQENEYLYTTAEILPAKFGKIHFHNLLIKGSFNRSSSNNQNLFHLSENSVIINQKVHLPHLNLRQLYINNYNGMSITNIMSDKLNKNSFHSLSLPADIKYSNLIVTEKLEVKDLNYKILNMNLKKFNFSSRNLALRNKYTSKLDITIEGELIIDEELKVDNTINEMPVNQYINYLKKSDIHIDDEIFIDNLTVQYSSTMEFISNKNFTELIKSIFSKSRDQELKSGFKYFNRITSKTLQAKRINSVSLDQLHFINDPLIFENDLTFTRLSANIQTELLHNDPINLTIFKNNSLVNKLITKMDSLRIDGSIFWSEMNTTGSLSESLSTLLHKAVTLKDNQTISASVEFSSSNSKTHLVSFISPTVTLKPDIIEIIKDSIINISDNPITITGNKNFYTSTIVENINVNDNIIISQLETMTIEELNNSLVHKSDYEVIIKNNCRIIGEDLSISQLIVPSLGPNMPDISTLLDISTNITHKLSNIHFKELIVLGNAIVDHFDDAPFKDFIKDRISIHKDYVIYPNVLFIKPVEVSKETKVMNAINGMEMKNLVMNESIERQVIHFNKSVVFDGLIVQGNLNALIINDVDIIKKYEERITADNSSIIYSDLFIWNNIKISSPLIVDGFVNNLKSLDFLEEREGAEDRYLRNIHEKYETISAWINESIPVKLQHNSLQLFDHFEIHENLLIHSIGNINKIIPVIMNNSTQLYMYGLQQGLNCAELPENCECRIQYVIELTEKNGTTKSKSIHNWITYHHRDPNNLFELYVKTNIVFSNSKCSLPDHHHHHVEEYTAISLSILNKQENSFFIEYPIKIEGYLSDVAIFEKNKNIYIILVINYDRIYNSHKANSFIYKLNLETYELMLKMTISMNAASTAEIFEIGGDNYIFICSSLSESILYRLSSITNEFSLIRTFTHEKSIKLIKHLTYNFEYFILLDDTQSNSIHIYHYNNKFDNFYYYQSLHHESSISSIDIFYIGSPNHTEAFVTATTETGDFLLYEFMIFEKFQLRYKKQIDGLQAVASFYLANNQYLVIVNKDGGKIFRIVTHIFS